MNIRGKLYAESPVYRGNTRKTLFTRDGDGTHRLVSLAGEISGTAQSLMDAFIGQSRDGKNIGLLNRLWLRLYGRPLPEGLIRRVECTLQQPYYPRDRFFDLRMGLRLDEDRWASEANANYKLETIFRNSVFDISFIIHDETLKKGDHEAQLYYLLQELAEGRFWFGAGKSKGLGQVRLELETPVAAPKAPPTLQPDANHLRVFLEFNAANPVLVGWNWGKVEQESPSFAAIDGRLLVEAMLDFPEPVRQRLAMSLSGPILSPDNWKKKLADHLPKALAIWVSEHAGRATATNWVLPSTALAKLSKGQYALPKANLEKLTPLTTQMFASAKEAEIAITAALSDKANMVKRIVKLLEQTETTQKVLTEPFWRELAQALGLDLTLKKVQIMGVIVEQEHKLAAQVKTEVELALDNEAELIKALTRGCQAILSKMRQQVDQQINLLQSDAWIDDEIASREEHLQIKNMLRSGEITERQWNTPQQPPQGVSAAAWRNFLEAHKRMQYRHLLNPRNLEKSIVNDENMILFLKAYRSRTRQELSQPGNIDFRAGGPSNREISRKHGKPYDTVFMRMLSWTPSAKEQGAWEVYIPGSTVKGAFKRRASQILKTLWGESAKTTRLLDHIFGAKNQRGLIYFSDAYLADPAHPERPWCSMDAVRMDPKTGAPVETAKHDYLYAYGDKLAFQCHLDLQDLAEEDLEAMSLLAHLLQDFARGDIPLGGEKTSGFGWVQGQIARLHWLTGEAGSIHERLFGNTALESHGAWRQLTLSRAAALTALNGLRQALPAQQRQSNAPPKAAAGFISHRAFGGHCGMLFVEAEVLTPLTIQESGEPSFTATLADDPVNGWDFFSMSPPEAQQRSADRVYALPSKTLKGLLRHVYTMTSNAVEESRDLSRLNPTDSLFGWVGAGQNQALMGRLSFSFGLFSNPSLAWFKVPYPYGNWRYANGVWQNQPERKSDKLIIHGKWRVFPSAPLAPCVTQIEQFAPDTVQASYCRAILPGCRACFTIRFWNLEKEELQRLIWTVGLEPQLAHKLGKHRYLGLGSVRLHVLPESYLIDWTARYAGKAEQEWRRPLQLPEWFNPQVIAHYDALRKALNAPQF